MTVFKVCTCRCLNWVEQCVLECVLGTKEWTMFLHTRNAISSECTKCLQTQKKQLSKNGVCLQVKGSNIVHVNC